MVLKRQVTEQLWGAREGGGEGSGHLRKWTPARCLAKESKGKERTGVILIIHYDGDLLSGTEL